MGNKIKILLEIVFGLLFTITIFVYVSRTISVFGMAMLVGTNIMIGIIIIWVNYQPINWLAFINHN